MAEAVAKKAEQRFEVGRLEDLEHGQIRIVDLAGREIGLVRWDDQVFAVRNVCPHVTGPACGAVRARLTGGPTPGTPTVDHDRPMLVCGWLRSMLTLPDE